jgi:intracellular septation protein
MKILIDFLPVFVFFIAFKVYGIYVATAACMGASFVQISWGWWKTRTFEPTHVITFVILLVLGGATLLAHNQIFIQWKPTIASWALGLIFFGSQFFGKKNFLQYLMSQRVSLPGSAWRKLNNSWAMFFFLIGSVNLYVVHYFSTVVWVNFKVFGVVGATLLFGIIQSIYMVKRGAHEEVVMADASVSGNGVYVRKQKKNEKKD